LIDRPVQPVDLDQRSRPGQPPLPYLIQVKLLLCGSNILGVVFFDHFPYQKIPVFDQNLHKNIFWRKTDQSLVGDTMKRKKWFFSQQWLLGPAGMGQKWLCWWWWWLHTPLLAQPISCFFRLLWLRAFNCCFRLGWGVPPFLVALASGFSAHHNYRNHCILFKDIYHSYLPDL